MTELKDLLITTKPQCSVVGLQVSRDNATAWSILLQIADYQARAGE